MLKRCSKIIFVSTVLFFATTLIADSSKLPYLTFQTEGYSLTLLKRAPMDSLSVGSYTIYVYDSENTQLVDGAVVQRDGEVSRAWVETLGDGFRVWVQSVSTGSGSYGKLDGFVLQADRLSKIEIKKASKNLLKGYRGHDDFMFRDGAIYREFPTYKDGDSNAKPSGAKRCLKLDSTSFKWKSSDCPI